MKGRRALPAVLTVTLLAACDGGAANNVADEAARLPASDAGVEAAGAEPPSEMPSGEEGETFDGIIVVDRGTPVVVKYRKVGNLAVVGGDMVVGTHANMQRRLAAFRDLQDNALNSEGTAGQRSAIAELSRSPAADGKALLGPALSSGVVKIMGWGTLDATWPSRLVAYDFAASMPEGPRRDTVRQAIALWNAQAPIRLQPAAPGNPGVRPGQAVLTFIDHPDGDQDFACASWVGYQPEKGRQELYLNPSCKVGNIVHEMGHAFGLHHEHQRPDRAALLAINSAIPSDTTNYGVLKGRRLSSHDLCSIMHYGPWTTDPRWFGLTAGGQQSLQNCAAKLKPECRAADPSDQVGQRCQLSSGDVESLNLLYGAQ